MTTDTKENEKQQKTRKNKLLGSQKFFGESSAIQELVTSR